MQAEPRARISAGSNASVSNAFGSNRPVIKPPISLPALNMLLMLFILNLTVQPLVEPDFGWHLRAGMDFLDRGGALPEHDPYSHTMPDWRWVEHAWLTDALIALLYRGSGVAGALAVMLFFAGIAIAAFLIGVVRAQAAWTARLAAVTASLWVALPFLGARTQLISLVGIAVLLWLHQLIVRGRPFFIWVYPPLFWLWANLHGGFTAGLVLLALLLFGSTMLLVLDRWWPVRSIVTESLPTGQPLTWLWVSFALSIALTFVNPYGWRLHGEIFDSLTDRFMIEHLQEWQPLSFTGWAGTAFLVYLIIATGLMLIWYRRVDPLQWALLAVSMAWSVMHWRNVTMFLVIAVPFVADVMQAGLEWINRQMPGKRLYPAFTMSVTVVAAALLIWLDGNHLEHIAQAGTQPAAFFHTTEYPIEAVQWMQAHRSELGRRLYNDYGYGGFLLWWLPREPIFIDGRMPAWRIGDRAIFPDYVRIQMGGRDALALLDKYEVDWCLMQRMSPLTATLAASPDWQESYRDSKVVIMRRRLSQIH